ncbi:flagellar basal body rod protein FlgB [Oceanicoccus sp. KOV_DT_Chl]|uniref:flagellar basal body rod protein FlgB n=1 Tax=Oceanicoccus sp. KOV_DT_Chl TaxID=1904639 RepID=UPI000C7DE5F0|nr:flagellar basal body rod protein FlgB [Oceanicoccus sp. KOV_DT_Chl]
MAINFQSALGIHEKALHVRAKRAEILANNLVNTDTPNFKARDMDFKSVLKGQMVNTPGSTRIVATNSRHIGGSNNLFEPELMYRNPMQPSLDGNTVDEQGEMSRYAQNTMDFQASFQLLNSKFKGLTNAIKGDM